MPPLGKQMHMSTNEGGSNSHPWALMCKVNRLSGLQVRTPNESFLFFDFEKRGSLFQYKAITETNHTPKPQ
jgi:hypothetical protein